MERLTHLSRRFAWDAWANKRLLEALSDLPVTHEVLSGWSHLLQSQRLWLMRCLGEEHDRLSLWTVLTVADSATVVHELERRWSHFLEDLTVKDLARAVEFTDTQGRARHDALGDILDHVSLQAAYHRGQLAVRMSGHGFTTPVLDFIAFARG
jgi:uncharacterized damage-inducible protein DinB